MGKSNSGKTSMRSIIFANYLARDTMRLAPTLGVDNSSVRFLGNLVLNLWDCGGQDSFVENYFESQKEQIFRNVEVLIYVFDIESREQKKDLEIFQSCLDALEQSNTSKHARVFCLIHKMDLINQPDDRVKEFNRRSQELKTMSRVLDISCFGTSIWDETLYKAWSDIVCALVPNIERLEAQLAKFCKIAQADEVVLFEKATFLVVSHAKQKEHQDVHRYEKISNIIKQFKLSCSKTQARFKSMEVKNRHFMAFIDEFTPNMYIMVIMTNPNVQAAATNFNIQCARVYFEKFPALT